MMAETGTVHYEHTLCSRLDSLGKYDMKGFIQPQTGSILTVSDILIQGYKEISWR